MKKKCELKRKIYFREKRTCKETEKGKEGRVDKMI